MIKLFELILLSFSLILPVLLTVAFFTVFERKVLASVQRRHGPQIVGFWGLLQALADGLKLISKEIIVPSKSNKILFFFAPCISFSLSFSSWSLIPLYFNSVLVNINFGSLFLFLLSSLNVYSLILSGWSSNSKYAFLGGLRSIAQMISYEAVLSICVFPNFLLSGSLNFCEIVLKQQNIFFFWPLFVNSVIFFICGLAETNRPPFDLPEAEAEIVAGYNVEYSSITFALFFLSEYSNILIMSALWSIFFWGGWVSPLTILSLIFGFNSHFFLFIIKIILISFLYIFLRANLPRYRYDMLMSLGWKVFLTTSSGFLLFIVSILYFFNSGRFSNLIKFSSNTLNLAVKSEPFLNDHLFYLSYLLNNS